MYLRQFISEKISYDKKIFTKLIRRSTPTGQTAASTNAIFHLVLIGYVSVALQKKHSFPYF